MVQQIFREHGGIDVFSVLIEDGSTSILVNHVMEKLAEQYRDKEIIWNVKFLAGLDI